MLKNTSHQEKIKLNFKQKFLILLLVENALILIAAMAYYHFTGLGVIGLVLSFVSVTNFMFIILIARKNFNVTYIPKTPNQALSLDPAFENICLSTQTPVIGLLLYEKLEKASSMGIILSIEKDENINNLILHPLTVTSVLCNLIDSLIAATSKLEPARKQIKIKLNEKAESYIFDIVIPDMPCSDNIETLIIHPGGTGKSSKQQYNLQFVKNIALSHGGKVEFFSGSALFKITLPKGDKCA
ncbi:MAG: hypothetical protein C4589_05660 [Peptococcaceae bacterium]|nr:MAG: hypothetical protein C4589_05660 [Peptococcaceae bacterium]